MHRKPTILLVEDETDVLLANQEYLEKKGMRTILSETIKDALITLQEESVDLVLLDVNLPDGSGLEFLSYIRANSRAAVILLTCYNSKEDVISGLIKGGDDYITKPYDLEELYARILAQLRRSRCDALAHFYIGFIEVDTIRQTAYIKGEDASLKPKEFALLLFLYHNIGTIVSSEDIYQAVWGQADIGDTRTVRVHISSLRKKLHMWDYSSPTIETLPNEGYCLRTC